MTSEELRVILKILISSNLQQDTFFWMLHILPILYISPNTEALQPSS